MARSKSGQTILVVDDDEGVQNALRISLEAEGYDVLIAFNGVAAQEILGTERVELVVTDIRMPLMDGVKLTQYIKENLKLPVIMMTGFSDLTEALEANKLGADAFLAKPFKLEELIRAIRGSLAREAEQQWSLEEAEEYLPLSIDEFISGREIQYDIFVRINEQKYVKVAHQGEDLSLEQVRAYKTRNIKQLFLKQSDFRKYVGFTVSLLPAVTSAKKIDRDRKVRFVQHTGQMILERVHVDGVDEEAFNNAKTFVESAVGVLSDSVDVFEILERMNGHADFLYTHSVAVCLYSVLVARALHWRSPGNLFKIALGGLFHDIGKKELDRELLAKPRVDLTLDEMQLLETHTTRGVAILQSLQSLPEDVLHITAQHHEDCAGSGYPSRLRKAQIHPLARLIGVTNTFCDLVLKIPGAAGLSPQEALVQMSTVHPDRFDAMFLAALVEVFGVKLPEELTKRLPKSKSTG